MLSTNQRLHQRAVARVTTLLRQHGYTVQRASNGSDLLVNGTILVGVRAARHRAESHRVSVGNKIYSYRYRVRRWNFSNQGKFPRTWPHFWMLVTHGEPDVFIVPQSVLGRVHGANIMDTEPHKRRGRFWPYLNRWDLVTKMTRP